MNQALCTSLNAISPKNSEIVTFCEVEMRLLANAATAKSSSVMSDSVRPHRWQPTRLCHPWDSPGKNTGVGCHFSHKKSVKFTSGIFAHKENESK